MAKKEKAPDTTLAKNRKAFHDYHILEKLEAGIELRGTEVKSCRAGNISLNDTYAKVENGELFLYHAHIAIYEHGNRFNHEPTRKRRLLMHSREIRKLFQQTREKGGTLIPLRFYLLRGKVKVELGVAKGKKTYDKRETLRKRQDLLDARKAMKR